jgi:hypothetical protein
VGVGAWRLRGYVVEQLLGRGSSGEVWRARVAATGEAVALKRISTADPEAVRRVRSEAALLTELDHPHLVRLHTLIPTGDASVLVLDLAEGGSLAQLLAARGRLTPGEVITAVAPVGAALAYLHRNGVVHGDVSAANILFLADGAPLLSDVGVARLTGDVSDVHSTPAYVDPAVAAGCVPGPQSDVFMLGAVALHALTGQPPWPATTPQEALALAAQGRLEDVAARLAAAGVPEAMSAVLGRALSVDPHRRGTAADLALDLRHSGEPLAVELAAGRARPTVDRQPADRPAGPRHAARPAHAGARARGLASAQRPGEVGPPAGRPDDPAQRPADPARPAFERPMLAARYRPPVGAAPPTRLVGPRPRPVIPRSTPDRFGSGRARLLAAAVVAVVLAAGGGAVWVATASAPGQMAAPQRSHASAPATLASSTPPTSSTPSTRTATAPPVSSTAPPSTGHPDPRSMHAALDRLDAIRARAFATRNAALLTQVYLPGVLLRTDTALLVRLVPVGCGLTGAHTTYARLHVRRHSGRIAVTTTASLAASRLLCRGRVTGAAPRAGPATLRLELADTPEGLRIATQQVS